MIDGENAERLGAAIGSLPHFTTHVNIQCNIQAYNALAIGLRNSKSIREVKISAYMDFADGRGQVVEAMGLGHVMYSGIMMSIMPLVKLDLCGFYLDGVLGESLYCYLAKTLLLKTLVFSGGPNEYGSIEDAAWNRICCGVAVNKSIVELEVCRGARLSINNSGMRQSIYSLTKNKTLGSLSIFFGESAHIQSSEALLVTLHKLRKNAALKKGIFSPLPQLSVSRGEELNKCFLKNYTLNHCPFRMTPDTSRKDNLRNDRIVMKAEMIRTLNKHGRVYILEDNMNKERGIALLAAVSNNMDCIFLHLKENPSLCRSSSEAGSAAAALKVEKKESELPWNEF